MNVEKVPVCYVVFKRFMLFCRIVQCIINMQFYHTS